MRVLLHTCAHVLCLAVIFLLLSNHFFMLPFGMQAAPKGSVFLLHACAHNPTGMQGTDLKCLPDNLQESGNAQSRQDRSRAGIFFFLLFHRVFLK